MIDNTTIQAFALHEILVGIAASLSEAEEMLRNQPPYDAFGRPNTMYQVPYLDFNLQVSTEFEFDSTQTGEPFSPALSGTRVKYSPAPRTVTNSSGSAQVYSTLSGRFVANIPNEGLPQLVIQVENGATFTGDPTPAPDNFPTYNITITAVISNAANEVLPGTIVEFNLDEVTTEALNATPPTRFAITASEVTTDNSGNAVTTVNVLQTEYDAGAEYVLTISVGNVSKSLSISNT